MMQIFLLFLIFTAASFSPKIEANSYLNDTSHYGFADHQMIIEDASRDYAAMLVSILQRNNSADFLLMIVLSLLILSFHCNIADENISISYRSNNGVVTCKSSIATMLPQKKPEDS